MSQRSVEIPLEFPVEYRDKTFNSVTVRRPKGKDLRLLPKVDDAAVEDLFPFWGQLLSGQGIALLGEEFLEELDAGDINAIGEKINSFLSKGVKTATPARRNGAK